MKYTGGMVAYKRVGGSGEGLAIHTTLLPELMWIVNFYN